MTRTKKISLISVVILLIVSLITGLSFLIYDIAKNTKGASYTLTLDLNGGSGITTTFTGETGTRVYSMGVPSRPGYKFAAWIPKNYVKSGNLSNFGAQAPETYNNDPFFLNGNSLSPYSSSSAASITIERVSAVNSVSTSPNKSYMLKLTSTVTGNYSDRSGFSFLTQSYQSSLFIAVFTAKIPLGYYLDTASDKLGADDWSAKGHGFLTRDGEFVEEIEGTGRFETYIYYVRAWDNPSGQYGSTGYFWLNGPQATGVEWYISNACMFDATGTGLQNSNIEVIQNKIIENCSLNCSAFYVIGSGNHTLVAIWQEDNWTEYADTEWQGAGTEDDPYLISSAEELAGLSDTVFKGNKCSQTYFKQTANINLSGHLWEPIGNGVTPFNGKFDGNGYRIKGMYLDRYNGYSGLFGCVSWTTIKNIRLENSVINTKQTVAGGLAGLCAGSARIENCYVDCDVIYSGSVNSNLSIGGAVGQLNSSAVVDGVESVGNVTMKTSSAKGFGGICGWTNSSTILNSINRGTIQGGAYNAGGITGLLGHSTITNCSNYGDIIGLNGTSGGIAGYVANSTISYCINDATIVSTDTAGAIVGALSYEGASKVSYCEARGYISSIWKTGGIAGMVEADGSHTIENCSVNMNCSSLNNFGVFVDKSSVNNVNIVNCYGVMNNQKNYIGSDFSAFGVVKSMNDGLPLLKDLYYIAEAAPEIDVVEYLKSLGFKEQS